MRKKCVIVGGSGFMGINLARRLSLSDCKVTIVDKRRSPFVDLLKLPRDILFRNINYLDSKKLKPILRKQDILFHFACSTLPADPFNIIEKDLKDNALGSIRLFRLAAESGIKKIIFPSSGGTVYGVSDNLPAKEDYNTNPICFHGIMKLMLEKYLLLFKRNFGLDYLVFRISNPYGPWQNFNGQQGLIVNILGKMLKGLPINIFGSGEIIRDYIYIDDVSNALLLGFKDNLRNDVYNIATGHGHTINEIIDIASAITNIKPVIIYQEQRFNDLNSNVLNIDKMRLATGWRPRVPIEEGIKKTYQWIKGVIS